MAEWLEVHAWKQGITGSIPGGGRDYHFEFFDSLWSQLGDDHTNEIKHEIHPE